MGSTTLIILMMLGCCCMVSLVGLALAFVYRDNVKTFFNFNNTGYSTTSPVASSNTSPTADVVPSPSPSTSPSPSPSPSPKKDKKDKKKKK